MRNDEYDEDENVEDNNWDEADSPDSVEHSRNNNDEVVKECTELFSRVDYIMEPDACAQIGRYLRAYGPFETMAKMLMDNYAGIAQAVNLVAEFLILAGMDVKAVQEMVESHLLNKILRHFDPKKADSIFTNSGETPSWLIQMIEYPTWRNLFYKLAEAYPDCLMLNFTIKLISDAGHQGEITSVSTACHQLEVFSRVLKTFISTFLQGGEEALEKTLPEFTRMVCHGEHTYLYSQLIMHILAKESKGGPNIRRLFQEVNKYALQKGLDVTPITLALNGASAYPRACQALSAMLSRNELNPADITVLYEMYSSPDPPPVELIRNPQFLDLFVDSLFLPGKQVNPERRSKYVYLMAYAVSVTEVWKKGVRKSINKDELKSTMASVEKGTTLCSDNKGSNELLAEMSAIFQCAKVPVVSMGMIKWVHHVLTQPNYFLLHHDYTPLHFILLDEISSNHPLLHKEIFSVLTKIFEFHFSDIDDMHRLNLKKMILDRLVHLLSCGYVLPIIAYLHNCWKELSVDVSLIRHFVTEVLDMVAPPYSPEFMQAFYPLIESNVVTGSLKLIDESDPISEFINHYKATFGTSQEA